MTDHLIIDGWNVCWKIPEIALDIPDRSRAARQKFNSLVKNYLTDKNVVFRIVYDGQPDILPAESTKDPNILFSKYPEKADQLIISFLQKQRKPQQWTVITSDRELAHKARAQDARILSSEDFISRLRRNKPKPKEQSGKYDAFLSRQEIDYWLQKFKEK